MNVELNSEHNPRDEKFARVEVVPEGPPNAVGGQDSGKSRVAADEPLEPRFDPSGPPLRVSAGSWAPSLTSILVSVAAAGTALFGLMGVSSSRTCGATRSSRLKWEERQQQIEADMAALRQQPVQQESENLVTESVMPDAAAGVADHDSDSQ